MPKTKAKKTFLKIKEKLVFVEKQQKKFFTKKFFGILFLTIGLALLSFTFVGFLTTPNFFKNGVNFILVSKQEFIPNRVIFPSLGMDFLVNDRLIEEKFKVTITDFKVGDEILVLGKDTFRCYLLSKVEERVSSENGRLEIGENNLKLTLTLVDTTPKVMIITGEGKL